MINVSIDLASIGTIILVLVLSLALGVVAGLLGTLANFGVSLFIGFAEAVAGGRSNREDPRPNKGAIAVRAVIYFALCILAIGLGLAGHAGYAYAAAVVGGIALPIATIKLLS